MLKEVQKSPHSFFVLKIRKLFISIAIISFLLLGFYFIFRTKELKIIGNNYYSEEQIRDYIVESPLDKNNFLLYFKLKYMKDIRIPFVQQIDMQMTSRNTASLYIYEKTVIGCIEYMGEHMYFDKDGIVVEASKKKLSNIPVVKGLRFDKIVLHESLEVQKDELFDVILNLTLLINKYELPIDSILFTYNSEVILSSGDIKASLGKHDMYDDAVAELKNPLNQAIKDNLKGTFRMETFKEGQKEIIFDKDIKSNA